MDSKMELFEKSDTTLVYIASTEFAKNLCNKQHYDFDIYIYVGRGDKVNILVYGNNDIKNIIPIDLKPYEYILNLAEKDR